MKRRREEIKGLERGSRARRTRQLARMRSRASIVGIKLPATGWAWMPRASMAYYREKIRRRFKPGYLFWAPLDSEPEVARAKFVEEWVSLGWTDEGSATSWPPAIRGHSVDYVVVDELHGFTPEAWSDAQETVRSIVEKGRKQ